MLVATLPRNRIGDFLKAKGRSIYWLAKAAGLSYQAVHGIVTSPSIPEGTTYKTLKQISEALEVAIDDLENDKPE